MTGIYAVSPPEAALHSSILRTPRTLRRRWSWRRMGIFLTLVTTREQRAQGGPSHRQRLGPTGQNQVVLAAGRTQKSTPRVNNLRAPVLEGFWQAPTIALDGDMAISRLLSAALTLGKRYSVSEGLSAGCLLEELIARKTGGEVLEVQVPKIDQFDACGRYLAEKGLRAAVVRLRGKAREYYCR